MNHLEAQSYIMPFINGQIPPEKQEEFVMHMKNCPKCHEELEVYYILLSGMKHLDSNEKLSSNLSDELDTKLNKMYRGVKGRQGVKVSAFGMFMAAAILVVAVIYATCINSVYTYEQRAKLSAQGDEYFATRLGTVLLYPDEDPVTRGERYTYVEEISNFERIHDYNLLRDQLLHILKIGEEIAHETPVN